VEKRFEKEEEERKLKEGCPTTKILICCTMKFILTLLFVASVVTPSLLPFGMNEQLCFWLPLPVALMPNRKFPSSFLISLWQPSTTLEISTRFQ